MIIRAGRVSAALIVAGTFIWGHGSGYAQTSTWKIDPAHSSVNFQSGFEWSQYKRRRSEINGYQGTGRGGYQNTGRAVYDCV